jgi:hypothetical protein
MEKKEKYALGLKYIAIILSIYLFVNLTLYVMGRIPHIFFWGVLAFIALFNFKIVPKLKKIIAEM